jgi:hypothetical protein
VAAVEEADTEADAHRLVRAPLRRRVVELLKDGTFNGWCAICNAHRATWRYELRRTKFATLADATPDLVRLQVENLMTNAVWGDLHKTTKPN